MTDYGTLLRDHVTIRCRSIDRIFLQAYVPRLQAVGDVCTFLRWQRKYPIPSCVMLEDMARVRITEDELARDTHAVLAKVQEGVEVIVEQDHRPEAVIRLRIGVAGPSPRLSGKQKNVI